MLGGFFPFPFCLVVKNGFLGGVRLLLLLPLLPVVVVVSIPYPASDDK